MNTTSGQYVLRASLLGPGVIGLDRAVLISVEHTTPMLPSHRTLQERHGLTAREAEVALLLAEGLSNRRIATHLGLSPHTVRHHAERIFAKLGTHSRKALGLRLLESPRLRD